MKKRMKKTYKIISAIFIILVVYMLYSYIFVSKISTQASISPAENTLNIYSWGEYITSEMIRQFTKETGIKVNLTEYDSNETMFGKLKSVRNAIYDIVVPSSYYVERMAKLGMLQEIDHAKLTNLSNIDPIFLNKPFDPNNRFSVPYLWGSTGIVINAQYIKNKITGWKDFWDPQYKNQLMLFNDMRDVFSIALLVLGYPINDTNPKHIEKAFLKLKELLPNIKIFNVDTVPNIYIDEDAAIGMIWDGDYNLAQEENPHLTYIYPQEGFSIWIDSFVIVKNVPHIDNAYKFINFMLRSEIAKQATLTFGHSNTNKVAAKLTPAKRAKIIQQGQILLDLDDKTRRLYEKYWERLKLGG